VYVFSGKNIGYLKSVEVYNPTLKRWSDISEMSAARAFAGAVSFDDLLYVVGGHDSLQRFDTVEVYSPASNSWRILAARMPSTRADHAVALLVDEDLKL